MALLLKNILFLGLLLSLLVKSTAQQNGKDLRPAKTIKLVNLSIDDGLSHGYISSVLQDKHGYLWIATRGGLNRYDGYSFTIYQNEDDSNSIASNKVKSLFLDAEDRLWMTFAEGGLDLFDKELGRFRHIIPVGRHEITSDPEAFDFLGTSGSSLVMVIARKFFVINVNKGSAVFALKQPPEKDAAISISELFPAAGSGSFLWGNTTKVAAAPGERIWISDVTSSLFELKVYTSIKQYSLVEYKLPQHLISRGRVKASTPFFIADRKRGLIYFKQYGNLYKKDEQSGRIELLMENTDLSSYSVGAADDNGNLWFSFRGFLYKIDVAERRGWFVFGDDPSIGREITRTSSACLMGADGNLWICTIGYGLIKINLRNNYFNHIRPPENSLFSTQRISLSHSGRLYLVPWIGSQYFFDTVNTSIVTCPLQFNDNGIFLKGKKITPRQFAANASVPQVLLQKGNFFLIEWKGTSLLLVEPESGFVSLIYKEKKEELGAFLLSRKNKIWFVPEKKLLRCIDMQTGNTENIELPPEAGLAQKTMTEDSAGSIWLAAENGICRYNAAERKWKVYLQAPQKLYGLAKQNVLCFCFTDFNKNIVWLGFDGKGFCSLNIADGKCMYLSEADGLPNKIVYGILPDNSGNLWLSTNKGISCYSPSSKQFRNYTYLDGLQSNEFNRYSFAKLPSGKIMFGGVNGVNYFNPDDITVNSQSTIVKITDLLVNNKPVVPWAKDPELRFSFFSGKKDIVLNHKNNFITFRFASSDLTAPDQNIFSYMLENTDRQWSSATPAHEAVYNNLPPGNYVFRVRGANRDGVWSSNEANFSFIITPPWWLTWWFKALVLVSIAVIIYFLFDYRLQQILKVQAIRNRISADMHDEIGSTLSSISFYSQALLMQNTDEKQKQVLEKIKENAQNVQEGLSDIVWSVKADMDSIDNVLSRMQRMGNELLEAKNIALHFTADEELGVHKMGMTERKNFYLIFKEAINNAAKYSRCKNVWVKIETVNQQVSMSIKDDGIGFDMAVARLGNGLGNMHRRAAEMKGSLTITSVSGEGTILLLVF